MKEEERANRAFAEIAIAGKMVKTGDLVTRTGNDFTSQGLRSLNQRDKTYSHCGIASWEKDTLFVYHALGGEFNPDQKIRRDLFVYFAEPYSNNGLGIFRYQLPDREIKNLLDTVRFLYDKGIPFDMAFDLKSDNRMYCAEFVYKSLIYGTEGRIHCATSHIGEFEFVGVDDLFLHPACKKIAAFLYK